LPFWILSNVSTPVSENYGVRSKSGIPLSGSSFLHILVQHVRVALVQRRICIIHRVHSGGMRVGANVVATPFRYQFRVSASPCRVNGPDGVVLVVFFYLNGQPTGRPALRLLLIEHEDAGNPKIDQ
jgi:hypothetical protein